MVFAPDGRLFFSEKDTGMINIMENEKVNPKPFAVIDDYQSNWEQGFLGLVIDLILIIIILYICFILA